MGGGELQLGAPLSLSRSGSQANVLYGSSSCVDLGDRERRDSRTSLPGGGSGGAPPAGGGAAGAGAGTAAGGLGARPSIADFKARFIETKAENARLQTEVEQAAARAAASEARAGDLAQQLAAARAALAEREVALEAALAAVAERDQALAAAEAEVRRLAAAGGGTAEYEARISALLAENVRLNKELESLAELENL